MENSSNMRIDMDELVRVVGILVQHFKEQQKASVEVAEDYYWEIGEAQLYDPTKDPSDFSMGQLTEDWQRLSQIASGEAPPIGYAFVWLGSVLRAIGQQNVP